MCGEQFAGMSVGDLKQFGQRFCQNFLNYAYDFEKIS